MKTLIVVMVLILGGFSLRAETPPDVQMKDGNAVLRLCEAVVNPKSNATEKMKGIFLEGYIRGYADGVPAGSLQFPSEVTLLQEVEAVQKWLKDHPERLQADGRLLISTSLKETFPPKKP